MAASTTSRSSATTPASRPRAAILAGPTAARRCAECGRRCKRHDLRAAPSRRAGRLHRRRPLATSAWRTTADLVFARAHLAARPRGRGRPLRPLRGLRRGARATRGDPDPGRMSGGMARGPPGDRLGGDGGARAGVLARARASSAQPRGAGRRRALGLLRGAARRPTAARARTTCSRACSRTSSRASRPCAAGSSTGGAAGTATACPVEIEVEKRLGISGKPQIEAYGIAEFNALCRESVLTYLDEWERLTERIGFWIDTDRAYRTMDTRLHRERLVEPRRAVPARACSTRATRSCPYCPRCGTALSSHEVALGYQDVDDPSVYVRFPLVDERRARCWSGRRRPGRCPPTRPPRSTRT